MTRAKAPPRALPTSDVTRPRTVALAAAGAAAGAGIVLAAARAPLSSGRPVARPHAARAVACSKCHEAPPPPASTASTAPPLAPSAWAKTFAASGACQRCHGATEHASTRGAHRALAAKGELSCATCHPAHEGAQGVTFDEGGAFVRWGAGAEAAGTSPVAVKSTTVPLVSLAACASCHDPSSAADPIAQCVPAGVRRGPASEFARTPSRCFDEHVTATTAGARFVAWEAAREVAARTAWVAPAASASSPWGPVGGAAAGAVTLGALGATLERRRRRPALAPRPAAPSANKRLPVIDPSTCLGCYACVDACPFDVIAIEKYVAVVARPEECCGVVLCEQVCPNGSLQIAEGEPVADRAATDEHLESRDVSGLFLAGDLTGLPLIKNAIRQGVQVADRIAATLPRRGREPFDVLVVGAGPAGLAAALRCKARGLSCVVVEQATVAASIKSFPRDKIVHDPPLDLPLEGELWLREATKEELLAQWARIVRAHALDIREGRRVTRVAREGEGFDVDAEDAGGLETFRASRVVLAIGRRGSPRELDLEIEEGAESRVAYSLADARSFAGKRVVVVGLGDSAMEAAIALAHQPGTSVTIAYRGSAFGRGKSRNVSELQGLAARGRVRILFETVPVAVTRASVTLEATAPGKARRTVRADALLVQIGGVASWDLLARCGIQRPPRPDTAQPDPARADGAPGPDSARPDPAGPSDP